MPVSACFKKHLLLNMSIALSILIMSDDVIASQKSLEFTPPPIPRVDTPDLKSYVRKFHTFPSPYGYEPYRDKNGNNISFFLYELNQRDPYIPVTFYCNSRTHCPIAIIVADSNVMFRYANTNDYVTLGIKGIDPQHSAMYGFYYPDDPKFYPNKVGYHLVDQNIKKGDALVTILFSQRTLQYLSEMNNGKLRGNFTVNNVDIDLPLANGKESLVLGTTLSVIGLGEASGVEFTETVSQLTGESYTKQVQTGFTIGVSLENQIVLGGGVFPAEDSFKVAINSSLSSMVTNGVEIANRKTVSRTYTIRPGINDTYYWAIYQLLYSYRVDAPLIEEALKKAESMLGGDITFKIADNEITVDKKLIGNALPPQASNLMNDVTVAVAVPVNDNLGAKVFSQRVIPLLN